MIWRNVAFILGSLLLVAGCSVDTQLGGVAVPNARPDTRITGQPPTLLEAGFFVQFNWTGSDPDGKIVGFQWKISDNGLDGISPRDTLTYDPLTGAEMNPWRFTVRTDSSFVVLADQANFPGDPRQGPRSFRSHSIFVRAVDDKGDVDPTPAYMSFTSTTLVPTARAVFPNLSNQGAKTVPPTVNVGWIGTDPDFELRIPTKARYLWRTAVYTPDDGSDPIVITGPSRYNAYYDQLIDFEDPNWSTWERYNPDESKRIASFPRQPNQTYWLFAVQTQDTAGAVSVGRRYQVEVAHFIVRERSTQPYVTVNEPFLGTSTSSFREFSIAAGQPLNFSWSGTAASYNGKVVSFRHGWDVIDVSNPDDPGWAVPPGLAEQNLIAQEQSFQDGVHSFHIRVVDDSEQITNIEWRLNVVPFVDYNLQSQMLVLDQTVDNVVFSWPDQSGVPRDDEQYRNEYWSFLRSQPGGVNGLDWELDRKDHRDDINYADLVPYKAVLCFARVNDRQLMFRKFRPENNLDKFVWLTPYQQRGGNLFLVGGSSMDSFLQVEPNYMTPVIFDTREESWASGSAVFIVGFGTKELPDGSEIQRGPLQYPYAVAGISALDWTSVNSKYVYARPKGTMKSERHNDCVGLKALVLDTEFRNHWLIGPGAIADTIQTNPIIDWQDARNALGDSLDVIHNTFPFRNDEFVNANISTRSTHFEDQMCDDIEAPGGRCIEPMFRGIARFDWLREVRRREDRDGDRVPDYPQWPNGEYLPGELDDMCGAIALTTYGPVERGSAKTNGKIFGYASYKMTSDKPSGRPDVYWGFDPYRFDNRESKKAIRWVLKEIFRLDVLDP